MSLLVLLIRWAEKPAAPTLLPLTLPAKRLQDHPSGVQIAFAAVLGDRRQVLHDVFYDAWLYDNTSFVIEKHIILARLMIEGPSGLADRLQKSCYASQFPRVHNLCSSRHGGQGLTGPETFDYFATSSIEMFA